MGDESRIDGDIDIRYVTDWTLGDAAEIFNA